MTKILKGNSIRQKQQCQERDRKDHKIKGAATNSVETYNPCVRLRFLTDYGNLPLHDDNASASNLG